MSWMSLLRVCFHPHSTAGIQLQRASRRRLTLFSRYQGIYKFKQNKTELNHNFQIVTLLYLIYKFYCCGTVCVFFPLNWRRWPASCATDHIWPYPTLRALRVKAEAPEQFLPASFNFPKDCELWQNKHLHNDLERFIFGGSETVDKSERRELLEESN